ncbi:MULTISPECIES: helix-turn-helix transcriptional regulator [Sphingobium]|uniref:Transcriptional regulator n=1 Tax=Sphingobium fuliginis (strain ATCC 27551) TaxID=336203 RepID=A0ABQ1FBL2_SPHSA|nr:MULTISPECIES: LuxR C-terminal-related transcriptional regulator [Sphingobium]AJR23071.1 LuxR family transcriptional regulator [Sphingobium sp. YBL2]RYL95984.1 helix-turn-helix transcriptional regulator [Sphingobium fuliginis]UXC90171.1 LuxR C-terminal-related transcriptional regulator [Sphingobium sp. RSMS]WDA34486.1 LuxR C-terminal-related transcriptional regulator [Sphingobium sp. YC-XJ3]GGA06009.1 transcriptional regulator [Sphingobium fuliginis]
MSAAGPSCTMPSAALIDAVRFSEPGGIGPAAERLRDAVMDLCGLRTAVTHNVASREPMRDGNGAVLASEVFGFRGEESRWWEVPQLALSSPIVHACRVEAEPFWCNAHGFFTRLPNPLLDVIDLHDFRIRAMTAAAIVVPIHLPFGQIGAASFLSPEPEANDLSDAYACAADALAVLARAFVQSYVKVTARARPGLGSISLTKREVECLRWAAAGKTNEEIGIILGLQRTTVRFHIRSASVKLDAVNRDQTMFKAAQLGFLGMIN